MGQVVSDGVVRLSWMYAAIHCTRIADGGRPQRFERGRRLQCGVLGLFACVVDVSLGVLYALLLGETE